ncbi:MAG TPA: DsbA family protein [Patescibacteria group bacterium]|nr:DsbA family protein [Patescibacteria group bacterium]
MEEAQTNSRGLIIGIVGLAVLIFAGLIWLLVKAPGDSGLPQTENVSFNDVDEPSTGPANAKVVVHVYSDFQCPACRAAEPSLEQTIQKFQDRVKFVWKDFPLEQLHPNARAAADAARCAQDQGWFWKFHTELYNNQDAWAAAANPQSLFEQYAGKVGMDVPKFIACYTNKAKDALVQNDIAEGSKNSVDATPTFFVGNKRYFAMPAAQWDQVLTQALSQTK